MPELISSQQNGKDCASTGGMHAIERRWTRGGGGGDRESLFSVVSPPGIACLSRERARGGPDGCVLCAGGTCEGLMGHVNVVTFILV